jgi:UDP-2,3-diacylglucosamine hydrolase
VTPGGDLLFVGDVHLDREDPHLDAFLEFLDRCGETASRIVLLGDLFNLWIGQEGLEAPHQRAVLDRFESLRRQGVVVRYIEGNRDYRIERYARTAFDDVTEGGIEEAFGGRRIFAIHGDLANTRDRQYRAWRRLSRSGPFWAAFRLLPRSRRVRVAESLEARMRRSNLEHKRRFPDEEIRSYGARFLGDGHDAVVLGHFHVEKRIEAVPPSAPGTIFVLPEWRESRRHLRVAPTGEVAFVDS